MNIFIFGGTGFIGKPLVSKLTGQGHAVTVAVRRPSKQSSMGVQEFLWQGDSAKLAAQLENTHVLINLGGENIAAKRWTDAQKATIQRSRLDLGQAITQAMVNRHEQHKALPATLIQASASGYYGLWSDLAKAPLCAEDSPPGKGFLAETAKKWEASTQAVEALGVRRCVLRTAPVIGAGGGFLQKMLRPFALYAGATPGSGKQPISFIHLDDVLSAIIWLIEHPQCSGPFNLAAPDSKTMGAFTACLARLMKKPCLFRIPAFALRLMLGEMADELILHGQQIKAKKLVECGFTFTHPDLESCLGAALSTSLASHLNARERA